MADLEQLGQRIRSTRRQIDMAIGEASTIARSGIETKAQIAKLSKDIETLEKAAIVLSQIGEDGQKDAQFKIESLVTQGLQKIFGPELSFHVVSSMRGKSPIVEFSIRTALP